MESTTHLAYFDMTTGLIEGWQHFADDLRSDNPLLAPARWIEALARAGFARRALGRRTAALADAIGQHVIVARAPGDAAAAAWSLPRGCDVAEMHADRAGTTASCGSHGAGCDGLQQAVPAERLDLLRELVRPTRDAACCGSMPARRPRATIG